MKLEKHKACWMARESKNGWTLGLCIGEQPTRNLGVYFADEKQIKKALKLGIVFVHKK